MKLSSSVTSRNLGLTTKQKNNAIFVYCVLGLVFVGALSYLLWPSSDVIRYSESTRFVAGMATRVQETIKNLQVIQENLVSKQNTAAAQAEMKESVLDFALHLKALEKGATVKEVTGKSKDYLPRQNASELGLVSKIKKVWSPLEEEILPLTKEIPRQDSVLLAYQNTTSKSSELTTLLDSLLDQIQETDAKSLESQHILRNVVAGLAGLALIAMPLYSLYLAMKREKQRANETGEGLDIASSKIAVMERAKSETDRIMETVQEGLFLIDEKGIIGEYYSNALPRIFRQEELAGLNLYGILQRHLSQKMYNTAKDFFTMLFDGNRKEKTILKVNPLTDVEINFQDPNGGFISRYLEFSFRRVLVGEKVDRIFVAVRDVTNQILLEKRLRESEKNKDRELEILLSIIHVPGEELTSFISLVHEELDSVNAAMRAEDFANAGGRQDSLRNQLQQAFQSIHNINGNAALLRLVYFQKAAHAFEEQIKNLQDRPVLSGDDFLSLVVAQAALRDDLSNLIDLRNKLKDMGVANLSSTKMTSSQESPATQLAEQLRQLVHTTAGDLKKVASLDVDEFALHSYSQGRNELVRDVLVQLVRNSIAHGVETPEVREKCGKQGSALLSIHALPSPAPGIVGLAFRDDGQGLDTKRIREKARSLGLIKDGDSIKDEDLVKFIFEPTFSTTDQADIHSGRGVGMSIIKEKIVTTAGGCIEIISEPGQYCEFRLYLTA
jgi:two-component system, chemotaxis family, sensor kinase CheA